jgi:hypothetical protein
MSYANLLGGADKSRFAQGASQDYFTTILNVGTIQQGTIAPIELKSDIVAQTTGAVGIGGMGRLGTAELADAQDNLVAELSGGDITFTGNVEISGDVIHSGNLDILGDLSCGGIAEFHSPAYCLSGLEVSGGDLLIDGTIDVIFGSNGGVHLGLRAGQNPAGNNGVAIGTDAGASSQGGGGVAVGLQAGQTSQGTYAVAVGTQAGQTSRSRVLCVKSVAY